MKPFWHPLSTLLLTDPRCFATPALLRMLAGTGGEQQVVYAGDRMWPTLRDGTTVTVRPCAAPARGQVVLACPGGIPDLLRVRAVDGTRVRLIADADPDLDVEIDAGEIMGQVDIEHALPGIGVRTLRRLLLDLREAAGRSADAAVDPAETVLGKYETQAPFYARADLPLDPALLQDVRQRLPPPGHLLVVGSGAGKESFALAAEGWTVTGVDFSPAMVELSASAPGARSLAVDFTLADIRTFEPATRFAGIIFTYDVYSFLPRSGDRVRTLERMRAWLEPGGAIYLSARRLRSPWQRLILTLQWLREGREWGGSHTRWVAPDGVLRRSFVRVFARGKLDSEIRAAGLARGPAAGGHEVLLQG